MKRLVILCLTTFFFFGCAFFWLGSSQQQQEKNLVLRTAKDMSWGFYQILWRKIQYTKQLDQELKLLGGEPRYVLFFRDLIRDYPREIIDENHQRGLISIISIEVEVWGRAKQNHLGEIINGKWDSYFQKWAQEASKHKKEVIYRFGFEMNGDWFPWGRKPKEFIAAWRRIHKIFQEEQASHVQWMFAPNVIYGEQTAKEFIDPYYPGDQFVDIVALDGYNFGDNHDKWHKWESYDEVFSSSIDAMTKFNKPLILSEIGCADDPRKAAWMEDFLQKITQDSRVSGFVYFHYDKRSEKEHNWRIDSNANSLQIFHKWLNN